MNNSLSVLPPEICQLRGLHYLNLSRNTIRSLPNEVTKEILVCFYGLTLFFQISELRFAETILLEHNQLEYLPSSIKSIVWPEFSVQTEVLLKIARRRRRGKTQEEETGRETKKKVLLVVHISFVVYSRSFALWKCAFDERGILQKRFPAHSERACGNRSSPTSSSGDIIHRV
jgi:hypothetical protein